MMPSTMQLPHFARHLLVLAFIFCIACETRGQQTLAIARKDSSDRHTGDEARNDAKRLVGTWNVVSATKNGHAIKDGMGDVTELTFSERDLTIQRTWRTERYTYRLNTNRTPKTLDTFIFDSSTLLTRDAYELDGDTLKFAFELPDLKPGQFLCGSCITAYPKEVSDKNQGLLVLKRPEPRRGGSE